MTAETARSITGSHQRILALPKDPNPYQELLYAALREHGAAVEYGGELTPSRTVNQLLLPVELAWRRSRGFRVLHLHWLFGFRFGAADRFPILLGASRRWMGFVLWLAKRLRFRIVWTAHNVLPHSPIFDDDVAARRSLVRASDLVIAHAANAGAGLAEIGARPRRVAIIPPGTYDAPGFASLQPPPSRPPTRLLSFGLVAEYKGIEDLVAVVAKSEVSTALVVAGECRDPLLRARLERLAAPLGARAALVFRRIADPEVPSLFAAAHAVVLPFRSVTTSSSVILALASGRPVVVPDLPAFDGIPRDAIIRYPAGTAGLASALEHVAAASASDLSGIGTRGRAFALSHTWADAARATSVAFDQLLSA